MHVLDERTHSASSTHIQVASEPLFYNNKGNLNMVYAALDQRQHLTIHSGRTTVGYPASEAAARVERVVLVSVLGGRFSRKQRRFDDRVAN